VTAPILAAGVVLVRTAAAGPQVLVVHRPARKDWSLPKGKVDPGENPIAAAVRECSEETGFTPVLQAPLPTVGYRVDGRPKTVRYWRAVPVADEGFAPDDEVDEVAWVEPERAASVLTYAADRQTVAAALALPDTVPLVVLRHTQAVKRAQFDGPDDSERPLTGKGRSQAKALLDVICAFGVTAVHASPARRCQQTVEPTARRLGVEIAPEPSLSEEGHQRDPAAAGLRAGELAADRRALVVCSHRPVLPALLAGVADALGLDGADPRWAEHRTGKLAPGGLVVVHRTVDGPPRAVAVEGLPSAGASAGAGA